LGPITKVNPRVFAAWVIFLLCAACGHSPARAPVIGEAFVGPATLNIRKDIPPQSAVAAIVKHGERLQVLQRHRTVFRVRTARGAEGWVDERQLLSDSDMQNLKRLAQVAAKLPSQGAATARYGDLRVYTLASRDSPTFITVKEKDKVDILAHVVAPRVHVQRAPILPPTPKKILPKKKGREPAIPPVPMPKPPAPPSDWQDLSKTESEDVEEPAEAPPTPTDDWSLVRAADGEAGWTLTRWLTMAIPDEVAQYAEGRRIVSYFSLGSLRDGDENKNIWLWTTIGGGSHAYDFDNFRVFIWSLRRHRYETAYIQRNVTGFAPVTLVSATFAGAQYPGFSVCIQKKDGIRYRQDYALLSNVIRFAGERPCETQNPAADLGAAAAAKPGSILPAPQTAPQPAKPSLMERVKRKLRSWFKR
jgi:SH3-like domain-containing protein